MRTWRPLSASSRPEIAPALVERARWVGNDDPALSNLDPGECAALALGITRNADLVLIDERRGYAAAGTKGFEVTGTLGILDVAAKRKLIDLRRAIERLKRTNFRYRKEIIESLTSRRRSDNRTPPRNQQKGGATLKVC